AFLAPVPPVGFGTRHRVTGPLLGGAGAIPKRLGVAACAAYGPFSLSSAAGGDLYHGSGFRSRCWSEAEPACHSSETGRANRSGLPCRGHGQPHRRLG